MSRVLLADDSAHAQRMGERILREEGYEVVTVTDGDTALVRLADFKPDLVIADALLPAKTGYELCEHVKTNPLLRHTRVVLAVGLLEPFDEERARRAGSDGLLKKPFEASAMLAAVRPLVDAARIARGVLAEALPPAPEPPPLPELDTGLVHAAVTVAVEAVLPAVVDEITRRVIEALEQSGEVRLAGLPAVTGAAQEAVAAAPEVTESAAPAPPAVAPAEEPAEGSAKPEAVVQAPAVPPAKTSPAAPAVAPAPAVPSLKAAAPVPFVLPVEAETMPEPAPELPVPEPDKPKAEESEEPKEETGPRHWRGFHLFR